MVRDTLLCAVVFTAAAVACGLPFLAGRAPPSVAATEPAAALMPADTIRAIHDDLAESLDIVRQMTHQNTVLATSSR